MRRFDSVKDEIVMAWDYLVKWYLVVAILEEVIDLLDYLYLVEDPSV
jgi:hypothetical protein